MSSDIPARLAAATGPDRALDARIWAHFDGRTVRQDGHMLLARNTRPPHDECVLGMIQIHGRLDVGDYHRPPLPRYTASIDSAVALVERMLPGWIWNLRTEAHASFPDNEAHAEVMSEHWPDPMAGQGEWYDGHAATPCLALLKALFAALDAKAALAKPGPGAVG